MTGAMEAPISPRRIHNFAHFHVDKLTAAAQLRARCERRGATASFGPDLMARGGAC